MFDIMAIPAVLLSLADAFLTQYLVGIGRVQEGNPLMEKTPGKQPVSVVQDCRNRDMPVAPVADLQALSAPGGSSPLFITLFYSGVLIWNSSILAAV
jgi:hypothetical protein